MSDRLYGGHLRRVRAEGIRVAWADGRVETFTFRELGNGRFQAVNEQGDDCEVVTGPDDHVTILVPRIDNDGPPA